MADFRAFGNPWDQAVFSTFEANDIRMDEASHFKVEQANESTVQHPNKGLR